MGATRPAERTDATPSLQMCQTRPAQPRRSFGMPSDNGFLSSRLLSGIGSLVGRSRSPWSSAFAVSMVACFRAAYW